MVIPVRVPQRRQCIAEELIVEGSENATA